MNGEKNILIFVIFLNFLIILLLSWKYGWIAHSFQMQVHNGNKQALPVKLELPNILPAKFPIEGWRESLPEIDKLLSEIETGHAKLASNLNSTTDGKQTELLIAKTTGFEVGDILKGFIQARDFNGKKKTHGGDYFRVRLVSNCFLEGNRFS